MRVAQLTELRPTRGSPDRRAEEDDDGLGFTAVGVEMDRVSVSVGQCEVGQTVADLGAGRVSCRESGPAGVSEGSRGIEAQLVAFDPK